MTEEYHESLYGALPGNRRMTTIVEGKFTHRRDDNHVAIASAAIQLRRQLSWVDDIHRAARAKKNEEALS